MPCDFFKLDTESDFFIWIDVDQPFTNRLLLEAISPDPQLYVVSREVVFQCFGPAQIIEEFKTRAGTFRISSIFEDIECGIDIYSDDHALMNMIYQRMILSPSFQELKQSLVF